MKVYTSKPLFRRTIATLVLAIVLMPAEAMEEAVKEAAEIASPDSDLEAIKRKGKITMLCVPGQENPFILTKVEKGPMQRRAGAEFFTGIDIEIMSEVARHLGVELEVVPAIGGKGIPAYSALIPALLAGEGDVIASAFSITPGRKKAIDFSEPYFQNQVAVVTRNGAEIEKPTDLIGLKIALVTQTSVEEYLGQISPDGFPRLEVEMLLEAYDAVSTQHADFLLDDMGAGVEQFLGLFDDLSIAFSLPVQDHYGLGLRPGSDLRSPINQALEELRKNGRLQEILVKAGVSKAP